MSPKVRFGVHYASHIALRSVVRMRNGVCHFLVKLGNNISLFFVESFFDCIIFTISSKKQQSKNSLCEYQSCHGKRQGVRHEMFHDVCH